MDEKKNFIYTEPLDQLLDDVGLNKYKAAGQVASKVVQWVSSQLEHGSDIGILARNADQLVDAELKGMFKSITHKGVCFPCCISPNHIAGHSRPTIGATVSDGDLVKIELGVHLDGFPALVCFTKFIGNTLPMNDPRARALLGAINASRAAFQCMKPGSTNKEVVNAMTAECERYGLNLPLAHFDGVVPGVFSYQVSQNVIDGCNDDNDEFIHQFIMPRDNNDFDFTMRKMEFEEDEVYAIDILLSTGLGKLQQGDTQLFKRNWNKYEGLRVKSSKESLSLFPKTPFPVDMSQQLNPRFRFGLKECKEKGLVSEYPEFHERNGEYVARIKFTVIVRDNPILVVGIPADEELSKII